MDNKFEKVREIIQDCMGDDLNVNPDTLLVELGMDSLDTSEVIIEMEDAFDISIPVNAELNTVQDLMNLVP